MVRIKDVADYVGVSTATVSNVINGKEQRVSKEVREKIKKALDEMGYVRNHTAMMLAQTTSNMIGVVIPHKDGMKIALEDPYYSAFLGNLEYEIRQHGCYMYLIAQQSEEEIIRQAIAWNLEGLIVCNMPADELNSLSEKYSRGIVSIDSYIENQSDVINISTDDFGGGYQMGKYLIAQGHRKIAMLADNDDTVDHHRWMGLKQAMDEAGVSISETDHFLFSPSESVRELQMEQFFPDLQNYTVLFVASDFYALEVSSFLQSKGIRIPQDISIAGFDDLLYAKLARPKLTTMSQNMGKKAKMAVEALLYLQEKRKLERQKQKQNATLKPNLIENPDADNPWTLPVKLVERESVRRIV